MSLNNFIEQGLQMPCVLLMHTSSASQLSTYTLAALLILTSLSA